MSGSGGHIGVMRQRQAETSYSSQPGRVRQAQGFNQPETPAEAAQPSLSARLYSSGAHPATTQSGLSMPRMISAATHDPPPAAAASRSRPASATLAGHRERQAVIASHSSAVEITDATRAPPPSYSMALAPSRGGTRMRPGSAGSAAAAARAAREQRALEQQQLVLQQRHHAPHHQQPVHSASSMQSVPALAEAPMHVSRISRDQRLEAHAAWEAEAASSKVGAVGAPAARTAAGQSGAFGVRAVEGGVSSGATGGGGEARGGGVASAVDPMAMVDRMLAEVAVLLQTQAFAYLARRTPHADPYDLRVVTAAAVRSGPLRDNHYTISEAGVTAFRRIDANKTDAQFTPLVTWRAECTQFRRIMVLPFFHNYARWRNYQLWHHQLNRQKRTRIMRSLKEHAFVLDHHFAAALLRVATLCDELRGMRTYSLTPTVAGASLASLHDAQSQHLVVFADTLDAFRSRVIHTLVEACHAVRDELEERLDATSAADLFGDAEHFFAAPTAQAASGIAGVDTSEVEGFELPPLVDVSSAAEPPAADSTTGTPAGGADVYPSPRSSDGGGGALVATKVPAARRSFQQRAQLRRLCERSARFVRTVQSLLHSTLLHVLLESVDELRVLYAANYAAPEPPESLSARDTAVPATLRPTPRYSRASDCPVGVCRRAGLLRERITPADLIARASEFEEEEERVAAAASAAAAEVEAAKVAEAKKRRLQAYREGKTPKEVEEEEKVAAAAAAVEAAKAKEAADQQAKIAAKEAAANGPLVLFRVTLALHADCTVGYSPAGEQWEGLLLAYVAQPVEVLAAVGTLLDEPVLQEYIRPQPISADVSATAEAAAAVAPEPPVAAAPTPAALTTNVEDGASCAVVPVSEAATGSVASAVLARATASATPRVGRSAADPSSDLYQLLAQSAAPHVSELRELVRTNYAMLDSLVTEYHGHGALYHENGIFEVERMRTVSLEGFRRQMKKLEAQIEVVDAMAPTVAVGIFSADAVALKATLTPSPRGCLHSVRALVPRLADEASEAILEEVRAAEDTLRRDPEAIGQFVEYALFLHACPEMHASLEKRWEASEELHELCTEFDIEPSASAKATRRALAQSLNTMGDTLSAHQAAYDEKLAMWAERINATLQALRKRSADERLIAEDPLLFDGTTSMEAVREHLAKTRAIVTDLTGQAAQLDEWQSVLKLPVTPCDEAKNLATSMRVVGELWECVEDGRVKGDEWGELPVPLLEPAEIDSTILRYQRALSAAERGLQSNTVLPLLRARVETHRQLHPLVVAMRNPNLKSSHLDRLDGVVGYALPRGEKLTVSAALEHGLHRQHAAVSKMASDATQEAALLEMLDKVRLQWAGAEFPTKQFKDSRDAIVLGNVDDILATLEETQLVVQSVLGSPHVSALRAEADGWANKLRLFSDTLDEWLACQRSWMYLESIFAAPDLQRQLPVELKLFQTVDGAWKALMKGVGADPDALKQATQPGLLDNIQNWNSTLATAQKRVEDHLETKRQAFPRFCFLSNDELLEILAEARNPQAVQPHLIKCFDCIKSLAFSDTDAHTIVAMVSAEGEFVPLIKPLKARGAVEEWLSRVEEAMQQTLHKLLKLALSDAPTLSSLRLAWCRRHPSQLVLTAAQVEWGSAVTRAFDGPIDERVRGISEVLDTQRSQLSDLAVEVSGPLDKLLRRTLVALITADVHARDITETMVLAKVDSPTSFTWQMQLRFVWESEATIATKATAARRGSMAQGDDAIGLAPAAAPASEDAMPAPAAADADAAAGSVMATPARPARGAASMGGGSCVVMQASATLPYGFEYEGVPTRLVVTPLTDRCWMTLTGALHLSLGGAPAGPAGTGKTESVKDLAKGIARQCVVYNCSEQLDYKTMGKLFAGVAQCGCWTCLDEFNRINIEVLSVVAQQLLTIRQALLARAPTCHFEGRTICVQHGCGVFITMNPGYAGRTELPDNLKALVRASPPPTAYPSLPCSPLLCLCFPASSGPCR